MNNEKLKNRLTGKSQNLYSKPADTADNGTELAISNSDYVAFTENAIEIVTENLKCNVLSHQLFDIIKAPTGGITSFTVPGLGGDEIQKEITGIIIDYSTPRAFWKTHDPVEGTPPTCYSRDSVTSYEGKLCMYCPYNEFGSKDGESNAKACKEFVEVYLLRPNNIIPVIVRIPVTSKYIFQRYITRLIGKMMPLYGAVTKITLEKATSKGGQSYAQFNFEVVNMLNPEEISLAKTYGQKFSETINAAYEVGEREAV